MSRGGRLLIVDDEEPARRLLAQVLSQNGYDCETAADAELAREALQREPFDLVLTDLSMPGDSGAELITDIQTFHPGTAVIMVTGFDDLRLGRMALQLGAYGYVVKPFRTNEIVVAVANALRRRDLEHTLRRHNAALEKLVEERTEEVRVSREETVHRLALAAEFRDGVTARHVERMSCYCELLARSVGATQQEADEIRLASLMHDVGKIGVPDEILQKPGPLTDAEWAVMRRHAELGHQILEGSRSDLLEKAATVALTHHERYDGDGYPNGLAGSQIPMIGRMAAVADVFDALTSDRPYREAMPVDVARKMIVDGSGTQFDPELTDLFLDNWDEVLWISETVRSRDDGSVLEGCRQDDGGARSDFELRSEAI